MKKDNEAKDRKEAAKDRWIAEIDRFAGMLREQHKEIERLSDEADKAKTAMKRAAEALSDAKDYEHETVSLLLKFIKPGSIDIMPLFDTMEKADDEKHGEKSDEWRKEPITSLNLSALAMRALIAADIVLVGQLQDRVLTGAEWAKDLEEKGITVAIAQAIESKLHDFITEKTK